MESKSIRDNLAEKLVSGKRNIEKNLQDAPICFVGFDGFTDEIIQVVDKRLDKKHFKPINKMTAFGKRILDAAGESCNLELVVRETKIGGNAPIMTNALLNGGHHIYFAGAIGKENQVEPLFQEMASQCQQVFPLSPSGHSDAIEFDDGKVILGKFHQLLEIDYSLILKHINEKTLIQLLNQSDLLVTANWTMLPHMTNIWKHIRTKIVPHLAKRSNETPRWMFVDLADPKKRTDVDVKEAMETLQSLEGPYRVILGLNKSEADRIATVLGLTKQDDIADKAKNLQKKLGIYQIVIHTPKSAASATHSETEHVTSPYTDKPFLTTGAGDNFNAGFCNALLYKLSTKEMLLSGVATAGYYVRKGKSPTISELAVFLKSTKEWKE